MIRRLARVGPDELICRGRQEVGKLLERHGMLARAALGPHRLSLEHFRAVTPRRFFDGAVNAAAFGCLSIRSTWACRVSFWANFFCSASSSSSSSGIVLQRKYESRPASA